MINEKAEFAAYTGTISYTAENRNDRTWLGRFTFDMLKEFEGMTRVLTILARGYMWTNEEPDCDRAYRALCAWCSAPESKNAGLQNKLWRDKVSFPELHTEFPELVDEKGRGWLYRHVKNLCRFAKEHPEQIDAYAAENCAILQKSFMKKLRAKLIHYQVPIFAPTTEQAWSLSFDSVIADAQEMGGRDSQKGKLEVSEDDALEKCRTYGELKQRYPNVWRKWRGRSAKHAECVLKKYDKWRECVSNLDISSMTDGERETHARMVEIYDRKCALVRETELCDDDEMTIAQFKENNDEVDRLDEESRGLKVAERNTLLRITAENMGRRLGWQEADTAEFAETLRAVGDVVSGDTMN